MINLRVREAMDAVQAAWASVPSPSIRIRSIATDTRHLERGSLFVGIVGDRFNGAAYAAEAVRRGAVAVIVQDCPEARKELARLEVSKKVAVAVVPDARAALGELAKYVRGRLDAEVIAITGSCGKTSTKAILAELLAADHPVISSPASFNNDIGVPRTIFLADERTEALVVEIGTNGPGEIAQLSAMARPRVALVTNVGRAHLEGLGSVEGVAREKGDLIASLEGVPHGLAVLNIDCPRTPHLLRRVPVSAEAVTVSASGDPRASLYATDVRMAPNGMIFRFGGKLCTGSEMDGDVFVSLLGEHAIANVLMAIATLRALNVPVGRCIDRLGRLQPEPHRMAPKEVNGVHLIDDTYNANPESLASAVGVLTGIGRAEEFRSSSAGRRVLVLGPMGELGPATVELHRAAGEAARRAGVTEMVLVGQDASAPDGRDARLVGFAEGARNASSGELGVPLDGPPAGVRFAATIDEAVNDLALGSRPLLPGDMVLAKASRAAKLEQLVDALTATIKSGNSGASSGEESPMAPEVHA